LLLLGRSVKATSGVHAVSYSMGMGVIHLAHEVDYSHTHLVPRLSMSGFILHFPINFDGVHVGSFTYCCTSIYQCKYTYTHLLTYLLHGAELFLRS